MGSFDVEPPLSTGFALSAVAIVPWIAGSCFLFGLLKHAFAVRLTMLEALCPQYLHTYCDCSPPSYNACLPFGLLKHAFVVRLRTLDALCPQYLQW